MSKRVESCELCWESMSWNIRTYIERRDGAKDYSKSIAESRLSKDCAHPSLLFQVWPRDQQAKL